MASPQPHSAPATVAIGYPAPHPPPRGHHRPLPPQRHAPLCNLRLKCRTSHLCFPLTTMAIFLVLIGICIFFIRLAIGAQYPTLEVTALTVSNLTVAASTGATWKASLLVERIVSYGSSFFREVECFIYYHWDTAQPLAVGSVVPFVLRGAGRTVIEVSMKMERPQAAVVTDMDRERRSVGMVVVGLDLRMRGRYVYASWWKKQYGRIEVHCDNLRIAFANSTTEGSLVISDHVIIGGNSPPPPLIARHARMTTESIHPRPPQLRRYLGFWQ